MNVLLVVLDGIADRSHAALGGLTPLQAAELPNLDALAASGSFACMYPVAPGVCAPADLAAWHLLGYSSCDYPGRAAFEALGAGVALEPDDVTVHVTLAATMVDSGERYVQASPTFLPDEQSAAVAASLSSYASERYPVGIHHLGGPFLALVLGGGASPMVTDSDPVYFRAPVQGVVPLADAGETAESTARELERFTTWAAGILADHPVTLERSREGMTAPNYVLTKWASTTPGVRSLSERWGFQGTLVASDRFYEGLAAALGMEALERGAGEAAEDLGLKLATALDRLSEQHDLAVVHSSAAYEASRAGRPARKVRVLEEMDSAFEPFLPAMLGGEGLVTVLVSGHAGPCDGPGQPPCSGGPVPFLALSPAARVDGVSTFDDVRCSLGALGTVRGADCMPLLLDLSGRSRVATSRPGPPDRPYR